MTVTIVDDSRDLRRYFEVVTSRMGFQTECFVDGQDFLDNYTPKPGVVILDLEMPRMSGPAVLRQLNELGWNLLVITSSAWASPDEQATLLALGAKSHLQLPVRHEQLESEINRVLGRAA